jgi:AcrR family transcriptional regulator
MEIQDEANNIPRRERERLQRHQDILDAAKTVFAREGYEKASLDGVAAILELSKGSIYYYFESKEALFISIVEQGLDGLLDKIEEAKSKDNTEDIIKQVIVYILQYFKDDNEFLRILFNEKREYRCDKVGKEDYPLKTKVESLFFKIGGIFKDGIKKGEIDDFQPELLAYYLFGFLHTVAFELKPDPVVGAETLTKIFFNGIKKK